MCLISALLFLFLASLWWEKAFATPKHSTISPGGCYRLVEYKPFWIVPWGFHPRRFPEEKWNPLKDWSAPWMPHEIPGFFRLFDSTGKKLGESPVYDLFGLDTDRVHWPHDDMRWMSAGYVWLADDLPPCPTPAGTLPELGVSARDNGPPPKHWFMPAPFNSGSGPLPKRVVPASAPIR